jgi:catechol 2,3-dioxygenase-like lactoylglutathione lyase family enzyme
MLSQHTPVATLPTSDLSRARSFYEGTLGLSTEREGIGGITYSCGNAGLFVYESSYAGTNQATAVSFDVPAEAFQEEVDALRGRGVEFMTFDVPETTWNDGVASMGESVQAVWFADPDGNILNISTGEM